MRKEMTISDAYLFHIEMLEAFMVGAVGHYHYDDYLSILHTVWTMIFAISVRVYFYEGFSAQHFVKNFAEFIRHYKYFSNFVFGEQAIMVFCFYLVI